MRFALFSAGICLTRTHQDNAYKGHFRWKRIKGSNLYIITGNLKQLKKLPEKTMGESVSNPIDHSAIEGVWSLI
jgi:hypothetical protein